MSSKDSPREIIIAVASGGSTMRCATKVVPDTTISEAIEASGIFTVLPTAFSPGRFTVFIPRGLGSFVPTDANFVVENHSIILVLDNEFIATK